MTYLHARTHYGAVRPDDLAPLRAIWRTVLGDDDCKGLDDRLIWVPDGENEPLSEWARCYRDIIGPPDPPTGGGDAGARDSAGRGPGNASGPERPSQESGNDDGRPNVGSLKDALERACERARRPAAAAQRGRRAGGHGRADGSARPGGRRTQGRRHRRADRPHAGPRHRPPAPPRRGSRGAADLSAPAARPHARTAADRQAHTRRALRRRVYARRRLERAARRPASAHPWTITRETTAPPEEPHALLVVDTSGSMAAHEYALGPIVWIVTTRLPRDLRQGRHRAVRQTPPPCSATAPTR
jgi:hypothetical protein